MTPRERVLRALNHEEADRVPIDFGSTFSTTINISAYENLKRHMGIQTETKVSSLRSQTAVVEEEVLQVFGVDTRGLLPGAPERNLVEQYPDGSYKDDWGVVRGKPKGQGHYLDVYNPLSGEVDLTDLEAYPFPDPDDPGYTKGLAEEAKRMHTETDYAVLLTLPVGIVHQTQFLRGYEEWMTDLVDNQTFFHALMEKVFQVWSRMAVNMLKAVGDNVDIVWYGDDVAFQDGPLCSLECYRKQIKPWQKKVFDTIRTHTKAKVLYHCCGSVYALMPDFIDLGIDGYNPVQVSAKGMDTKRLKAEFGDKIAFWGGVDTQRVLCRGTPQDVWDEVRRRIQDLALGGGYVLNSVHNIQREVPPQNVVAMFEAGWELGKY